MNLSIRQKALHGLAAVLFGITGTGVAQESGVIMSMPAPPCAAADGSCPDRQISVAVVGAPPPNGLAQVGVVSTGGMGIALQDSVQVVKNQPYQAQAVTEIKQTLADGSHIAQTTTATVARDSDGRSARIQQLSTIGPWRSGSDSSQGNGPTLTTIFDPIAKTHTDFTSDNRVAHVAKMPPPPLGADTRSGEAGFAVFSGGPAGGPTGGGSGPMTFAVQGRANSSLPVPDQSAPDAKSESLGSKTIEGIPVTGTKTTTTIPVGAIGNDKDLLITRETWYSPDLKLVIQSTQTDPRFGETTYSLTNIQRSEPDPALFQVPAGYTTDKLPVVVRER
jgi:hypothetical protein